MAVSYKIKVYTTWEIEKIVISIEFFKFFQLSLNQTTLNCVHM